MGQSKRGGIGFGEKRVRGKTDLLDPDLDTQED